MNEEEIIICNGVTSTALKFFEDKLSPKGKPNREKNEWTVYSAFVLECIGGGLRVVSAGTGSKCLGRGDASELGDLVHDSHAEVVARRAFRRFLLEQMKTGSEEVLVKENDVWKLRKDVRFHLFSTHVPCGDATISPKSDQSEKDGEKDDGGEGSSLKSEKANACVDKNTGKEEDGPDSKRLKLSEFEEDLNRTGAKCLPGHAQDAHGPGQNYHTALGALRTKPGRGDPTHSLSCSDKILRWNRTGLQGKILSKNIPEPIKLKSLVLAAKNVDLKSVRRALEDRDQDHQEEEFLMLEYAGKLKESIWFWQEFDRTPSHCSAIFAEGVSQQVSVDGRKQGCIRKHHGTPKSEVCISRRRMAQDVADFQGFGEEEVAYEELKIKMSDEVYSRRVEDFKKRLGWPERRRELDQFKINVRKDESAMWKKKEKRENDSKTLK